VRCAIWSFMLTIDKALFGKPQSTEGQFSDVHDGSVFKGNCLIGQNEDCFGLILYQDSFEIVNPLG